MNIFQTIEKLQHKSEGERHVITFWIALSVTGVIALGWMVSLITLRAPAASSTAAATGTSLPGVDPFQDIGSNAANFYEQFTENISQIRSGLGGQEEFDSSGATDVSENTESSFEVSPQNVWEEGQTENQTQSQMTAE